MKNQKLIVGFLLFTFFYLISHISSCAMPTISKFAEDNPDVEEVFRTASTISLIWNYDNPATIESYNLYYSAHSTSDWILLNNVTAAVPFFEVTHSSVGDGSWDFGVSAVDFLGNESEIHSSLDLSADPNTGWYLLWAE